MFVHFRVLLAFLNHFVENVQPIVKTFARYSTSWLDVVEMTGTKFVESEMFLNFLRVTGTWKILFVGQDQNGHLTVIRTFGRSHQLHLGLFHSLNINAVHNEYDGICLDIVTDTKIVFFLRY